MQGSAAHHIPEQQLLLQSLEDLPIHLVGIKGTGMAALAEVLSARGARVTGSDTNERFYTDAVLRKLSIPFHEGFTEANLDPGLQLVIHSAAYSRTENPELVAAEHLAVPIITYPEALGMLSGLSDSSGISGVHGKSTTTALCGAILKAWGFPATVLVGAEVPAFGGRSALTLGDRYLVAETCEYRRHFLHFHPERIVMTSVEPDHLDYFHDLEDIQSAFEAYGRSLPFRGTLIHCADDPGARATAERILRRRDDLHSIPYGRTAEGDFKVQGILEGAGSTRFSLSCFPVPFTLHIPGEHSVLNAAAAIALCVQLWQRERGEERIDLAAMSQAISSFTGCRRRSEIVGEARGILIMDDYAHHPTAVEKTLAGIKRFHPGRRLIVDFMSHTYSRTRALLPEFAACFGSADVVILHRIYASAREKNEGGISGRDLFNAVSRNHPRVHYFEEPRDALPYLEGSLGRGDLLITMGAGDNWKLGRELLGALGGGS